MVNVFLDHKHDKQKHHAHSSFSIDAENIEATNEWSATSSRFDLGDTIIRYQSQTFNTLAGPFGSPPTTIQPFTAPGSTKNNFQFNAGIGYRF